jgi:hypothetical protein
MGENSEVLYTTERLIKDIDIVSELQIISKKSGQTPFKKNEITIFASDLINNSIHL